MADMGELQARIQALSDAYAAQLPEKLRQIEEHWAGLGEGVWDEADFETLHRMVHSLTGSGKTFGFVLLSAAARNLEELLESVAQAKAGLNEDQRARIEEKLRELQLAALRQDAGEVAGLEI